MKRFSWVVVVAVVCIFGLVSFAIRNDYGWNWDASQHFIRGQAYFRLFTTGKTTSEGVQLYQSRKSYYEVNPFDITWLTKVIGHPPTTDIILASVNQLFYKRLGILNDMESYYVYGIVLTFLAALAVGIWSYQISGWVGGVISVIAFYGLPLLFSEQHFNFKDPAVMAYNTIFLYMFWLGITKKKTLVLLLSAIVAGISLGTKFNILFLAPVVVLWLFWYSEGHIATYFRLFWIPVVMVLILYATYPLLWNNFLPNVGSLIDYYRQVGGNRCPYMPLTGLWFWRCIDFQTARLFMTIIPLPTIFLSGVGIVVSVKTAGKYKFAPILWSIALSGIILRVILPINSLYGGSLRQILEFIGPMAMLVGLGANWFVCRFPGKITGLLLFLIFIPVFWNMWSIHPDENLYTNILQGMFWKQNTAEFVNGIVSYGNAYKDGIAWINTHAEPHANVSLVIGLDSAISASVFRSDIQYGLTYWSGYDSRGEYLLELVNPEGHPTQLFPYKYVTNMLDPVYEKRVKGYPIVRVWKNDVAHAKPEFRKVIDVPIFHQTLITSEINLQFSSLAKLQMLSLSTDDVSCRQAIMNSYILVSTNGHTYDRMYETVEEMNKFTTGVIRYPFAGESAEFIKIFSYALGACEVANIHASVMGFQ